MKHLSVLIVQPDIVWEHPAANRAHIEELLHGADRADMIVLPEFFNTGFSVNNRNLAELPTGTTVQWMQKLASRMEAVVSGTLPVEEDGKLFNRAFYVSPTGIIGMYNKRHLFSPGDEHLLYSQGMQNVIIEVGNFKIRPQICYDLRFPVWSRNRLINNHFEYDLLIYHANWPDPRGEVWKQLLIARAIENQVYVIGVNRTGKDGEGMTYSAPSYVIDYKGRITAHARPNAEDLIHVNLELEPLLVFRKKFNVSRDWDNFTLNL